MMLGIHFLSLMLILGSPMPERHRCSLYFAGDIMQHQSQLDAARTVKTDSTCTYVYDSCFAHVRPEITAADVAVCNLETTLGGEPYTGYPAFCSPDALASALQDAGFDICLTANNHCLDRGARGLRRTLDVLDSLGIRHLGTYRDKAERDSLYPFILEQNGMRIALLNYTYSTNGIEAREGVIVNYIDTVQIALDIDKARAMNADCIIACMHWGTEYMLQPDYSQKILETFLYNNGVDHIIGGHPHVVQPVRTMPYPASAGRHLTVWSLGNYISGMSAPHTDHGLAVTLYLSKTGSVTTLSTWRLHPNRTQRRPLFTVIPE